MKILKLVIIVFILLILAFLIWIYIGFYLPYQGVKESEIINIEKGQDASSIASLLKEKKIIRNRTAFLVGYRILFSNQTLKAGEYSFSFPISGREALTKIIRGEIVLHLVTIPEGLMVGEIAQIFEQEVSIPKEEFLEVASNINLITRWDKKAKNLEGYLFPDSYHFPKGIAAEKVVSSMVDEFFQIFTDEWRKRALELGMTIRQIVTLASLIEKETSVPVERTLISAVFHNRLKKGMKLECDPTIIYALKKEGIYQDRLRKRDLAFDSPYNTYLYYGLPPGPICSPGKKSIEAALYPASVNYLYFVSKNDGTHYFSNNLKEHNQAVRKYQKPNHPLQKKK
ncbi:MAG: endolytic transglycosylase MltG [Candidatus Aminicenantia bacterium]